MMLSKSQQQKSAYLFMLPIIALIFSAFTFKKYPIYVNATTSYGAIDTLVKPNQAIKDKRNLAQVMAELDRIKLSGKVQAVIDTVEIYDSETYEQKITVVSYDMPKEVLPILMDNFNYSDNYYAIIDKYATNKKEKILKGSGVKSNK